MDTSNQLHMNGEKYLEMYIDMNTTKVDEHSPCQTNYELKFLLKKLINMKICYIVLFLILGQWLMAQNDIKYLLQNKGQKIHLEMTMQKEQLDEFAKQVPTCMEDKFVSFCLRDYIQDHFIVRANKGERITWILEASASNKKEIQIQFSSSITVDRIKELEIKNDSFLDFYETVSNKLLLNFDGKEEVLEYMDKVELVRTY